MKNLKKFFPQESSPIIKLILRFKSWIYNAPVPPEIKTSKNRSTELTSVKSICGKCGMEIPWVEQNRRQTAAWAWKIIHPIEWKNKRYYTFLTRMGVSVSKESFNCLNCGEKHYSAWWARVGRILLIVWF